ncbi:hypothetical protein DM01DRAFT_1322537 [Hesseltinella vesiculosa]|uniref:GOLD domain-containing protein n=1 Tax=Hesseltinella vesiculosa TaxID=101127 RepID=A0A1X2GI72_9FUNG|nr:hypothetical protein DM01DRAFT_1322537 [Hesseltinella vesiculosa]
MTNLSRLILIFAFSCILIQQVRATVLSYSVAAHERPCFHVWVDTPNKKIGLYFAVQSGGAFDIDYKLTDPQDKVILEGERERQGDYVMNARHAGEYSLCFSNEMSTFAEKLVDFEFIVEQHERTPENLSEGANTGSTLAWSDDSPQNGLEESLFRMSGTLTSISRTQKFLRTREHRNHNTVASTEQRIFWFASLESIAIITMAVLQVFVIRGFFGQTRRGGV